MSMQREHHLLQVGGARIHAVSQGQGPLVLLIHGFPESWYSWRHQLSALAAAGYRAVAIDQRGYGQSSKFYLTEEYRIHKLVADAVGVVKALGEQRAVVVGHDWGAPVAWTAAWLHPEVFSGVVGMSVPFSGRGLVALPGAPFGEKRPLDIHREIAGADSDFYQDYFAARDGVVAEIESDLRSWLRDIVVMLSGDSPAQFLPVLAGQTTLEGIRNGGLCIPHGGRLKDNLLPTQAMPSWFTEQDLDFYTGEFQRSGLGGPLSFYSNIDHNWFDLAAQEGKPLLPPALFIGGEFDVATNWGREAIERAPEQMPNYRGSHIIAGSGHWIQQEYPEQTNRLLLEFLASLD